MKYRLHKILVVTIVFTSFFIASCNSDDDPIIEDNYIILNRSQLEGSWKVTYFWDQVELTTEFNNYEFLFNSTNVLKVTIGEVMVNGTINLSEQEIDGETATIVRLNFDTTNDQTINDLLGELTERWAATGINTQETVITLIETESISEPERIEFTKI